MIDNVVENSSTQKQKTSKNCIGCDSYIQALRANISASVCLSELEVRIHIENGVPKGREDKSRRSLRPLKSTAQRGTRINLYAPKPFQEINEENMLVEEPIEF